VGTRLAFRFPELPPLDKGDSRDEENDSRRESALNKSSRMHNTKSEANCPDRDLGETIAPTVARSLFMGFTPRP
jgi:hypothetical protein